MTGRTRTAGNWIGVMVAALGVMTACSSSEPGAIAEPGRGGERVAMDGVTFVIPEQLADELRARPAEPARAGVQVVLIDADATQRGTIRVTTVSDARGGPVAGSPDDGEMVGSGEADTSAGEPIDFVNGSGTRRVVAGEYVYEGRTSDGSHLVEFRADDQWEVETLDALSLSIYVDGQSAALASTTCTPAVEVISDVTLDVASPVGPGEVFTASWRVRNSGSCVWSDRDGWVFSGGDGVEVIDVSPVGGVAQGEETDVRVTLRAPIEAGSYSAQWQFLPAGQLELLEGPVPVVFEVLAIEHSGAEPRD